jgi:hypothetical protein
MTWKDACKLLELMSWKIMRTYKKYYKNQCLEYNHQPIYKLLWPEKIMKNIRQICILIFNHWVIYLVFKRLSHHATIKTNAWNVTINLYILKFQVTITNKVYNLLYQLLDFSKIT